MNLLIMIVNLNSLALVIDPYTYLCLFNPPQSNSFHPLSPVITLIQYLIIKQECKT